MISPKIFLVQKKKSPIVKKFFSSPIVKKFVKSKKFFCKVQKIPRVQKRINNPTKNVTQKKFFFFKVQQTNTLQLHYCSTTLLQYYTTTLHYTILYSISMTTLRKSLYKKKKSNKNVTNQRTIGLISADRSNKATLLLTIPRSKFKSSAKDLSSLIFEVIIQGRR